MVKPSNSESDSNINRKSKNVIRIDNKDKLSGPSKDKPVRKKLPFSTSPQNNKNDDVKKVEKRGTTKSASLERYKSPSAKRLQKSRSDETETLSSIPRSLRTAPNSERRKSSDNKKEERSSSSGPTSNNRSSSPPVPALQNRSNSPPVPALQNRTLSPPVPALQRKCISLPIIKITDFDDGNTEIYYTDSCEYDDDDDDDESPYGTTELLSESEDRIYKTKKKNEDSSKIDSRYKKPVTPSLPKPRPSSSITTYKQYKLEIQRQKDKEKKAKRSQSFDEPINLRRSRKVNLKDAEDILNIYEDQRKYAKPKEPPNSSRNKKYVKLKKMTPQGNYS